MEKGMSVMICKDYIALMAISPRRLERLAKIKCSDYKSQILTTLTDACVHSYGMNYLFGGNPSHQACRRRF